ncbi:amidohydrolase [Sphingomonas populi]|uniref:Amidohydrolase n=1 Tax=Sphingomonas populi TaxID=2484750 RepID=A0A4Q6XW38_9SPHN|nr:amidohydrolase family protein [Sphingomonas populi]RZF60947.1 amidohydrolase [Sphingomonas populi]
MRQWATFLTLASTAALTAAAPSNYSEADFARVAKLDAHVHANRDAPDFLRIARTDGFELLSINVDYPDFPPLATQATIAYTMHAADPKRFHFATTFSMDGFGSKDWTAQATRAVDTGFAHGAVAVKVWKNIGMIAKDTVGKRVFLDDPRFDPIMAHIQARGVPLIAHQGEPKNCWLPLDEMTTDNDRTYFSEHPEYYMYEHPEEPRYEQLMAVRDRFVARHPKLAFDGAHMASLEWSVDELARFLDLHPNAVVDLAARMSQVQVQSNANHAKVRAFFLKYQDRLMYGTDLTDSPPDPNARAQNPPATGNFAKEADDTWRSDWRYLATPLSQPIAAIKADAPGLALPRSVIDKIYYANARRFFHLKG